MGEKIQNPDYKGLRVFLTGAGGFIGSHLAEALVLAGANVKALVRYTSRGSWGHLDQVHPQVRDSLEVVLGDVRDSEQMRAQANGCDVIFHLAALIGIPYSYEAPQSYLDTNIRGTMNILDTARSSGKRLIVTSTSEVYGTAVYTPIDEAHPLQGQSPYSASKISADKLAESYYRSFGVNVVTVRPFNTYGPRQSARAVIPTIVSQLLSGSDSLRLGSLEPVRDLTYVSDTVRGFLLAGLADKAVGQVINLGNGQGISIGDLAHVIMDATGRQVPITCDGDRLRPPASEVQLLIAKTDRARDLLDWEPQVSLKQGIHRVVDHITENLSAYRASSYAL